MTYKDVKIPWPEWEVEEQLGKGGFGAVYRICRKDYGNTVYRAVKVIKIPSDQQEIKILEENEISVQSHYREMVKDLMKEISLMESLKGASNIVNIEDYKLIENIDSIGWTLYIRMELLIDLSHYIKKNSMNVDIILKLGIDICNALVACDKVGIIHRDVKVSNILVSKFGEFKLGDFGISRNLENTMSGLTRYVGTSAYMAPEVYFGKKYNKTADIYSLGLVLYRLLNKNILPFEPLSKEERTGKRLEEALVRRMRGEVFSDPVLGDRAIGYILRKACHVNPTQRYQSAEEFKKALRNYRHGFSGSSAETLIFSDHGTVMDDAVTVEKNQNVLHEEESQTIRIAKAVSRPNFQKSDFSGAVKKRSQKDKINEDKNAKKTKKKSHKSKIMGVCIAVLIYFVARGIGSQVGREWDSYVETTRSEESESTPQRSKRYVTTANVNMRLRCDVTSEIIATIPKGTEVWGEESEKNWILVSYDAEIGYASSDYLEVKLTKEDNGSVSSE